MQVKIIGTGSTGNTAVIDDTLIIDAGCKEVVRGKYLFLSHSHTDHTKYLSSHFNGLAVFATEKTQKALLEKHPYVTFNTIEPNEVLRFDGYVIRVVPLKHDVECMGFEIYSLETQEKIFFATDFNEIVDETTFINSLKWKNYNALYIECNNTLSAVDFVDELFTEAFGTSVPKDSFHKNRSFRNHSNADYITSLFERAGYSENNRFTEPVHLLHKSKTYYPHAPEKIVKLCKIANIINPIY